MESQLRLLHFAFGIVISTVLLRPALGSDVSAIGRWVTIDDKTHTPRSVVDITEVAGILRGKIAKIYERPGETAGDLCTMCTDERRNKPILGMTILDGLRREGDVWSGGTILDPDTGKVYSATIGLQGSGEKLNVRGYIGISLFGRSQTWMRETATLAN
jgi:uncharacterized protein (DUF2147 family)